MPRSRSAPNISNKTLWLSAGVIAKSNRTSSWKLPSIPFNQARATPADSPCVFPESKPFAATRRSKISILWPTPSNWRRNKIAATAHRHPERSRGSRRVSFKVTSTGSLGPSGLAFSLVIGTQGEGDGDTDGFARFLALALRIQELVAGVAAAGFSARGASEETGEVTGDEVKLSSADTVACGKGVPVDNGLRRRRGFEGTTGFSPRLGVCTVASGVDEIVGVGVSVGDKIGVSVGVRVT